MDLSITLFVILASINILVLILVSWTLYEFHKLDHEQFKYYIIGLCFYGVAIISFLLEYLVLPPLNNYELAVTNIGMNLGVIFGMFYFLKGTRYLAQREQFDTTKNESVFEIVSYLMIAILIESFILSISQLIFPKSVYNVLDIILNIMYIIIVSLLLKLFLEYRMAFNESIRRVISQYIIAVILVMIGGLITAAILQPLRVSDATFLDVSHLRQAIAIFGAFVVLIPFIICYRSVAKFRKVLTG